MDKLVYRFAIIIMAVFMLFLAAMELSFEKSNNALEKKWAEDEQKIEERMANYRSK